MLLSEIKPNQPFTLQPVTAPSEPSEDEGVFGNSSISLYAIVTHNVNPSAVEYKSVIADEDMLFIKFVGSVEVVPATGYHDLSLINRPTGYFQLLNKNTKVYPYIHPQKAIEVAWAAREAELAPCFKEFLNGIDL
jgi:hypothetical protein